MQKSSCSESFDSIIKLKNQQILFKRSLGKPVNMPLSMGVKIIRRLSKRYENQQNND